MTQRNYYQVLGVRPDATQVDIRAAFVRLTKLHHPDIVGANGDLPWRLQDVQQAYRCLSVTESRNAHDTVLAEAERQHFARQRVVQSRLKRYDRRHPHALPRHYKRRRWPFILLVLVGIGGLASLLLLV